MTITLPSDASGTIDLSQVTAPVTVVYTSNPNSTPAAPVIVVGGQNSNTFVKAIDQTGSVEFVGGAAGSTNVFQVAPSGGTVTLMDGGGSNSVDITTATQTIVEKDNTTTTYMGITLNLGLTDGQTQFIYQGPSNIGTFSGSLSPADMNAAIALHGSFKQFVAGSGDTLYAASATASGQSGSNIVLTGTDNTVYGALGASVQSFMGGNNVIQNFSAADGGAVNTMVGAVASSVQNYLADPTDNQAAFSQLIPNYLQGFFDNNPANGQGFLQSLSTANGQGFFSFGSTNGQGFLDTVLDNLQGFLSTSSANGQGYLATVTADGQGFLSTLGANGQGFLASVAANGQGFLSTLGANGQGFLAGVSTLEQGFLSDVTANGQGFLASALADGQGFVSTGATNGQGFIASVLADGQGFLSNLGANGQGFLASLTADVQALPVARTQRVAKRFSRPSWLMGKASSPTLRRTARAFSNPPWPAGKDSLAPVRRTVRDI